MIRSLPVFALILLLSCGAGPAVVWAQPGRVQQDLIDQLIVPPRAKSAPIEPPNATTMRRLRSKAEFKVEIMPLAEFAKFLAKRYKIRVRLDPAGLQRASVERGAPISADIADMPLSEALKQILGRLNLDYRVVNGAILITDRRPDPPPRRRAGRVVLHNGQAVIIQNGFRAGNGGEAFKEQALRQLGPLLQVELVFAKRIGKPSKEQMQKMRDDLQSFVKDEVNEFFDLMQGRVARSGGGFHVARKLLDDRLATYVETNLSKEKAAVYRAEVQKRDAHERAACALNLVTLLDRDLSLSSKQRDALERVLLENWDESWSATIEVGAMRGQKYMPSIPDEVIEPQLDPAQVEVWEGMTKIGSVNWGFQVFRLGWFGMPVDEQDKD